MQLDRRLITGPLDKDTPICVLIEVAATCGLHLKQDRLNSDAYLDAVIAGISETQVPVIDRERLSGSDYSLIARFVNPIETRWDRLRLLQALDSLFSISNVSTLPVDFVAGAKTDSNPLSYDASQLYRFARQTGVKLHRGTTFDQLVTFVRGIRSDTSTLRQAILFAIKGLNHLELIKILSVLPASRAEHLAQRPTQQELIAVFESLNGPDRRQLFRKLIPTNDAEAITYAAINFDRNISEAKSPLNEYDALLTNSPFSDPIFRVRYERNPTWFRVSKNWSPILSHFYSAQDLCKFAISEGIDRAEIKRMGAKESLQLARLTPTFYAGWHPDSQNDTAVLTGELLSPAMRVITYGTIGNVDLIAFTVEELVHSFESNLIFVHPLRVLENIPMQAIRKLKRLADELKYEDLRSAIRRVEIFTQDKIDAALRLRKEFSGLGEADKRGVTEWFHLLLEVAMYMRGWKIRVDHFPLVDIDTNTDPAKKPDIDINVSTALIRLEEHELDGKLKKQLFDLPLIKFQHVIGEQPKLRITTNAEVGLTIVEKINIVKANDSQHACIRDSSNYLAGSAYYYLLTLGQPAPFDLAKLSAIS